MSRRKGLGKVSLLLWLVLGWGTGWPAWAQVDALSLSLAYREQVDRQLTPPSNEVQGYGELALERMSVAGVAPTTAQYVAVVDRSPAVQAIFIYWLSTSAMPVLVGASPVSTGRIGRFDHFETPLGIFEHSLKNPDFRAEGTKNKLGIRGYGIKGMRVFDFGWQTARRGWGYGQTSRMRLQMHATDPELLERRLGSVQSKGCIRIPATLNRFLDHFGLLDADYESTAIAGAHLWVLSPVREPVPDAGRYLIVVDTRRSRRPDWSPPPR